jgi:hypothetical protein
VARARSLSEFQTSFPDEMSCAAFLFERRWPQGFVCPACGVADRGFCAGQCEDRNDAAHRRAQIVSRAHRLPTRPADGRQDGRPYRAALDSSRLRVDEALGARHLSWTARKHIDTYLNEFVFRYNRRFYRHVSFETMLGLASRHHPTGYWDIVGRDNPRKGMPTVRRQSRRRKTATGMRADRSRPPEKVEPSSVSDSTR